MPRNDLLLFADLECTGADLALGDEIIEVGFAVYSWPERKELGSFSQVVLPSEFAKSRMASNPKVLEMHTINGLAADVEAGRGVSVETCDKLIDEFLLEYGTRESSHIPLGGSGISHFDRPFIRKYLPLFDKRVSYWHYDVGVVRRMFILAGARHADDSGKTHRALDDARVHAEEFFWYMDRIKEMVATQVAARTETANVVPEAQA